ncbi:hypothetical protein BVX94_01905 [bacterium B17]|nr:hypothetical protein BVX94_01905 [bacterium B17]
MGKYILLFEAIKSCNIKSMLKRIARFCIGLLLIPVCVVMTQTAAALMHSIPVVSDSIVPLPLRWLAGGFAIWVLVYFILPAPVRTYVLAHELTHALWGAMMGARVSNLKVAKESGSVTLSKTNFLITLAPYFFPFYTMLIIAAYYITGIFVDVEKYYLYWLGLVGFTWGFHFTFTIRSLLQKQTDIKEYGYLFSYTVIFIFNVLCLILWIVLISSATLMQFLELFRDYSIAVSQVIWSWSRTMAEIIYNKFTS